MVKRKVLGVFKEAFDRRIAVLWDRFRAHHEMLFCAIVLALALVFLFGLFLHSGPYDSPEVRFDLW